MLTNFPPRMEIAFFPSWISASESADLYDTKVPPFATNGRQYSLSTARLDTARETQRSYCCRCVILAAISSALPCIAVTFSNPSLSITSFKKLIRLFRESINVISRFGNAIFNGSPGKPAPVPRSMILKFCSARVGMTRIRERLSRKCF